MPERKTENEPAATKGNETQWLDNNTIHINYGMKYRLFVHEANVFLGKKKRRATVISLVSRQAHGWRMFKASMENPESSASEQTKAQKRPATERGEKKSWNNKQ